MKKWYMLAILLTAVSLTAAEPPQITEKGIVLDFGSGGKQTLSFPQLRLADGKSVKPEVRLGGNQAALKYDTPDAPQVVLILDGEVMHEEITGNGAKGKLQYDINFPTAWADQNGAFAFPATTPLNAFSRENTPGKAIFASGSGNAMAIKCGKTITLQVNPAAYWQFQDNREWKWSVYALAIQRDIPAAGKKLSVNWSFAAEARDPGLLPELTARGVQLDFGLGGKILINYPLFKADGGKNAAKPAVDLKGNRAVLRYLDVENAPAVTLELTDSTLTGTVESKGVKGLLQWESYLPIMWHKEGSFAMPSGSPAKTFPQEFTAEKTQLGSGSFKSVTFCCGNTVTLQADPGWYWQLQDNRAWKWNTYALAFMWSVPAEIRANTFQLDITNDKPQAVTIQVDRFGQSTAKNWPGKITSEDELKADLETDKKYYGAMEPPRRDRFGGLLDVKFEATGFFRLGTWDGRDIMITPDGHPVYHLAVCSSGGPCDDYTYVKGREFIYEWLPASEDTAMNSAWLRDGRQNFSFYLANYIRKTGKPFDVETWRDDVFCRYKKLGFNAQGAFAASLEAGIRNEYPVTRSLPLSPWQISGPMADLADPFDPAAAQKMDQLFAPLAKDADNPFIIGYFIQNERHYSEVPRKLAGLGEKAAAKREFVKDLQQKYGSIADFNAAWEISIPDFPAAVSMPLPVKTKAAWQDAADFSAKFYHAYFKLVHDTFRKYDRNHLLLGDRFLPGETNNAELVAACGKYNDVFSVNYYTQSLDLEFLTQLHARAGKPLMLSEWSYGTSEEGLSGGCINVKDQKERGQAYRNYVEQTAALPFVIGTQWFAAIDQALTGRFFQFYNGENMNIGLFNVADRPFRDFHDAIRETNYSIYEVVQKKRYPYVWTSGTGNSRQRRSLLAPHAADGHKIDGVRMPWPTRPSERIGKNELVLGQNKGDVHGDFWLCWDQRNLYLFIDVNDPTPCLGGKNPESFWNGDGVELFLGADAPDQPGELRFTDRQLMVSATPGGGAYWAKQTNQVPPEVKVLPFAAGNGYSMELAIPWSALNVNKPEKGMKLRFDIALDNSDGEKRTDQLIWSGTQYNHSDRTMWGTATLVD